jgi:hypothetical protein
MLTPTPPNAEAERNRMQSRKFRDIASRGVRDHSAATRTSAGGQLAISQSLIVIL